MQIRPMRPEDLREVIRVWNACVDAGEVLYYPLTEDYFRRKFTEGDGCEPGNLLVAADGPRVTGFIHGVAPETFRLARPGQAYLTCLLVDPARRGEGAGRALLESLKAAMKARGAATLSVSSLNPVNLDWRIPGTPGHDHNNMPGLDNGCAGFGFFEHSGFIRRHDEVSMYLNLADYRKPRAAYDLLEALDRLLHVQARDGLQLVQRSPGKGQTASRHFGDRSPASGDQRPHDKRGGIPDPAGRMLVQLDPRQVRQVNRLAGMHHRIGQVGGFPVRHGLEAHRHHESRHLVIRDFPCRISGDHRPDRCPGQFSAARLPLNAVHHPHDPIPPILSRRRSG